MNILRYIILILLFHSSVGVIFGRTAKAVIAYGIAIPTNYKIHGIDVSRYQEKIDWKEMSKLKSGKDNIAISFSFIKATEGQTMTDRYFTYNWKETKKHNIIRGAYHYYKPNTNSLLQARNFIKAVKLQKGDLPPVLDIEELGKLGAANMQKGILNWLRIVEKHYGIKPIIYTNAHFYKKYLSGKDFKDYPFWIAHYTPNHKIGVNREWVFWQHSDRGKVKNIRSSVSFSVLNGNMRELKSLCKK